MQFPSRLALAAAACFSVAAARADVFLLHNGGRIEGTLKNPDERPRKTYIIETRSGGEVTLSRDQVKRVVRPRPEEREYEKIRDTFPDTAEGQWELAEWCRENDLDDEAQAHLERVIELDPEHAPARSRLGFRRVDGKWKTREEFMADRGMVQDDRGRWVMPQELELKARDDDADRARKLWYKNVKMWRRWLDADRVGEAVANFSGITDPAAVPALVDALPDEAIEECRKLYIAALAQIGSVGAFEALAEQSLADPSEDVRLTCLEYLAQSGSAPIVEFFVDKLKDKNNVVVNRAAVGLAYMNDPSAIAPLIDALVTTHKFKVTIGRPGGFSPSFGSGGMNGFGAGSSTRVVSEQYRNADVLDALVALTGGVNFEFDADRWSTWLAAQKQAGPVDVRRD